MPGWVAGPEGVNGGLGARATTVAQPICFYNQRRLSREVGVGLALPSLQSTIYSFSVSLHLLGVVFLCYFSSKAVGLQLQPTHLSLLWLAETASE